VPSPAQFTTAQGSRGGPWAVLLFGVSSAPSSRSADGALVRDAPLNGVDRAFAIAILAAR
jgi:hypothetical protein